MLPKTFTCKERIRTVQNNKSTKSSTTPYFLSAIHFVREMKSRFAVQLFTCVFVCLCLAIGSISMTDQSDDEFDHDNLVESKVSTLCFSLLKNHLSVTRMTVILQLQQTCVSNDPKSNFRGESKQRVEVGGGLQLPLYKKSEIPEMQS